METSNDNSMFLEPGRVDYLDFYLSSSEELSTYSVSYEVTEGMKYLKHKSCINNLTITTNRVPDDNDVMVTMKNNGSIECSSANVAVLFYDSSNKLIDIQTTSFQLAAHTSDVKEVSGPCESWSRDELEYSRYEAFITTAYHLGD